MFKDVLAKRGITCYSLAKETGISYTAINELYRGEREIGECSFKNVISISSTLNISLDDLKRECSARASIPNEFKKYFWDTDIRDLQLKEHMYYIIPRLLRHGGYEGFKFVWENYTYEEIKKVAIESRNLGQKQAYSLKNFFKLKESQMAYFAKRSGEWR